MNHALGVGSIARPVHQQSIPLCHWCSLHVYVTIIFMTTSYNLQSSMKERIIIVFGLVLGNVQRSFYCLANLPVSWYNYPHISFFVSLSHTHTHSLSPSLPVSWFMQCPLSLSLSLSLSLVSWFVDTGFLTVHCAINIVLSCTCGDLLNASTISV